MKFGICASPDSVATLAPGSIDYIELSLGWIAGITSEEFGALKNVFLISEHLRKHRTASFPEACACAVRNMTQRR